jgi:aryl-alcohol dehydrogenase-like predicted oxidoreductase
MQTSFDRAVLGRTGIPVCRLGVSASYGVPGAEVQRAFDEYGVNYLYWGSRRSGQFGQALRHLAPKRDRFVLVLQSYSRMGSLIGWSVERALRAIGYDHADFLLLGMFGSVPPRILDAARKVQERGLVRHLAVSTHRRKAVPGYTTEFDCVHFRYSAVHTGAERDIFPHLPDNRGGMVSFTATSWGQLIKRGKIPATDCYRFVLGRPEVDVCMTGPRNAAEMQAALDALRRGPLDEEEMARIRRAGQTIYGK